MKRAAKRRTNMMALATALAVVTGCRLLPSFSDEDEVVASTKRSWVQIDMSQLATSVVTPAGTDPSPLQQDLLQRRLKFLSDFARDTNEWFMPFAANYLPGLKASQEKRILPVLSDGALILALNQRDIEIRLLSTDWAADTTAVIPVLRHELLRPAVNRILTAHPSSPFPEAEQNKNDMIRQLFAQGVPIYLSSFGMPTDSSPLGFALAGERDLVEEQFRVLRGEGAAATQDERQSALTRAGLWICYKIETTSGTAALVKAIQEGPNGFYKQYLATGPGILLSLDQVPIEISPQMDEILITH
jgi:hypothetical protein